MKNRPIIIVSFLLLSHLLLCLSAAVHLSPAWDEINYPVSGAIVLHTGSLSFYPRNPCLARLIYGGAALAIAPEGMSTFSKLESQDPAMAGFHFLYQEVKNPITALVVTRFPAILLSLVCALLIFWTSFLLWGESGAILSLICYLSIPIFLSRASLALLEMPMFVFMMAALIAHQKWLEEGRHRWFVLTGFFSVMSILCKLTAVPIFGVIILSTLLAKERPNRFKLFVAYTLGSLIIFTASYCVWRGGVASLIASLKALIEFNRSIPFYWRGRYREGAPSLISWVALAVKAPLVILGLFMWALVTLREKIWLPKIRLWFMLTAIFFILPLFFDLPVSTVQLSPLYLGVAVIIGSLGQAWGEKNRLFKLILAGLLTLGMADALRAHPNYLSYFNVAAGGINRGSYWLADSDQDWGQSLPSLAADLHRRPPGLVVLSYSGAGDPAAHGVPYLDLISAALVSHEHRNILPSAEEGGKAIYLAIGTKMKQIAPEFFDWIESNRRPIKIVDGTFEVFEISQDVEALHWLATCYALTRRPAEADWFEKAAERREGLKRLNGRASNKPQHP